MDQTDDLRGAVESAFDASTASDAVASPEPVIDTPAETESARAERARDEGGRFAKGAQAPVAAPVVADPNAPAAVVEPPKSKAPSSWKKEAAALWDKVEQGQPLTLDEAKIFRTEAARREEDFHKGIEGFKTHADAGRAYQKALEPYQSTLQQLGVDGVTAVSELMKADNILRTAPPSVKIQKLVELANVYGIDLSQQFSQEQARYEKELYETRQELDNIKRNQELQVHSSLNSDIEKFKTAPGHEHFESVRAHMAALLSGGQAQDLEDAYEQAVYANPQTRAAMLEQQRAQAAGVAQAQRARQAASGVRGSSPASGTSGAATGSIKDAVAAAWQAHT